MIFLLLKIYIELSVSTVASVRVDTISVAESRYIVCHIKRMYARFVASFHDSFISG